MLLACPTSRHVGSTMRNACLSGPGIAAPQLSHFHMPEGSRWFCSPLFSAAHLKVATCRAQQLQFALNVTAAVLPAFEQLFRVPFTLPKLDLVAIPDFAAGAMENWGLITYRCAAVLVSVALRSGASPSTIFAVFLVSVPWRCGVSPSTVSLSFLCQYHE